MLMPSVALVIYRLLAEVNIGARGSRRRDPGRSRRHDHGDRLVSRLAGSTPPAGRFGENPELLQGRVGPMLLGMVTA